MEIRFNRTGAERKALVEAISGITGHPSMYMGAPSFAYTLGGYTVDRNGTLTAEEQTDPLDVGALLEALAEQGVVPAEPISDEPIEDTPANRLSIEVPLEGFSDTALSNLEKLVASKASLIKKAIGAEELPIVQTDGRLCFPWFDADSIPGYITAYTQFIHALCEMAKTQKRVTAKEQPAESEKYAFRCFLLRLGFIGKEFAQARRILLYRLSGSGSFKNKGAADDEE